MARTNWNIIFLNISSIVFFSLATFALSRRREISQNPQQVHITLSGRNRMRITWITTYPTPATVYYGTSPGNYPFQSNGSKNMYHYIKYKSGEIHDVVIGPLKPNTLYYYRCGIKSSQEFSFKSPPAQYPIKFAVAGDLGQTSFTVSTLYHIAKSNYDVLLLPGDLSYADRYQPWWDSFGQIVQPYASKRPWMVTVGNHDVEKIKGLHRRPFTSYNARWVMPYEESCSPSNLFYSFETVGAHVVMLGSYTDFEPTSAQYKWLVSDLKKVDRRRTPWLIVVVHAPWYNSNEAHQGEYESVVMRNALEDLVFRARVDVVFAGHVHAYERFVRVYKDRVNECGPIYITSGAGGNREGLALRFLQPPPKISAFRVSSFGSGRLTIVNGSHATWTWHRNDNVSVPTDKLVIKTLANTCLKK